MNHVIGLYMRWNILLSMQQHRLSILTLVALHMNFSQCYWTVGPLTLQYNTIFIITGTYHSDHMIAYWLELGDFDSKQYLIFCEKCFFPFSLVTFYTAHIVLLCDRSWLFCLMTWWSCFWSVHVKWSGICFVLCV